MQVGWLHCIAFGGNVHFFPKKQNETKQNALFHFVFCEAQAW